MSSTKKRKKAMGLASSLFVGVLALAAVAILVLVATKP